MPDDQDALLAAAAAVRVNDIPPDKLDEARDFVRNAIETTDVALAKIKRDLEYRQGVLNDREWRARANDALHHKVRLRQRLQHVQGDISRRLKAEHSKQAVVRETGRERMFIQLARPHLGEALYLELWAMVDRINEKKNGGE